MLVQLLLVAAAPPLLEQIGKTARTYLKLRSEKAHQAHQAHQAQQVQLAQLKALQEQLAAHEQHSAAELRALRARIDWLEAVRRWG